MATFYAFSCLISFILAVLGLIHPPAALYWGKIKTRRKAIVLYGSIALASFFAFAVTTESTKKPNEAAIASTRTKSAVPAPISTKKNTHDTHQDNHEVRIEEQYIVENDIRKTVDKSTAKYSLSNKQKEALLGFTRKSYAISDYATSAVEELEKISSLADQGQYSIVDLVNAMKDVNSKFKKSWLESGDIKVPDGLPSDISNHLEEYKKLRIQANYCRMTGTKHALIFLDSRKPKDYQEYQQLLQDSSTYTFQAHVQLSHAYELAGLDVTEAL